MPRNAVFYRAAACAAWLAAAAPARALGPNESELNKHLRNLPWGTESEQLEAVKFFGSTRMAAGVRPMMFVIERHVAGKVLGSPDLMASICTSLGRIRSPVARETLFSLFDSTKKKLQDLTAADKKSGVVLNLEGLSALYTTYFQSFSNRREADGLFKIGINALVGIGGIDDEPSRAKLVNVVNDPNDFVELRLAATRALAQPGVAAQRPPAIIDALRKLIADDKQPALQLRAAITHFYVQEFYPPARKVIIEGLRSNVDESRRIAAQALEETPMTDLITFLEDAVKLESEPRIREALRRALRACQNHAYCCDQP